MYNVTFEIQSEILVEDSKFLRLGQAFKGKRNSFLSVCTVCYGKKVPSKKIPSLVQRTKERTKLRTSPCAQALRISLVHGALPAYGFRAVAHNACAQA